MATELTTLTILSCSKDTEAVSGTKISFPEKDMQEFTM